MINEWLDTDRIFEAIDEWWPEEIEEFLKELEETSREERVEYEVQLYEVLTSLLECYNTKYVERILDLFPEWLGNGFLPYDDDNMISLCIRRENMKMLRFLLDYGVDPDQQDWDNSGLDTAVKQGNFEAVVILLNHGAAINYYHFELVNKGQNELILEQLLMRNTRYSSRALVDAVQRDWKEGVELYLAYGADVNFVDSDGQRALDYAETINMRRILKKHGAKKTDEPKRTDEQAIITMLEEYSSNMNTAVRRASKDYDDFLLQMAEEGHFSVVEHILNQMQGVGDIDGTIYSAVVRPGNGQKSWFRRQEIIEKLWKKGVRVTGDPIYAMCMNPMDHLSPEEKQIATDMLDFFRKEGCMLDDYMADGISDTALGCAVMRQNELCLNWLLKSGVTAHSIGEDTPLHVLLFADILDKEKAVRIAQKLMAAGLNPEVTDYAGNTVLHDICEFLPAKKLEDRIAIALMCGVDPHERNNAGKTAYQIAMERGDIPEEVLRDLR